MANTSSTTILNDGDDSGDPTPATKLHVAFNSGGKCCFPDCGKHLTLGKTNTGECAHIIPRKVGFEREDRLTPLEDRKKAENLIYLCRDHHKVVDDPKNAADYPASLLFEWKKEHETQIASSNPNTVALPESVQKTLNTLAIQLSREMAISTNLINGLLKGCKELLKRRHLDKAATLIDQAGVLLASFDDKSLLHELDSLKANLLWKQEKIPEAKQSYLKLLESYSNPETMLDYIELCASAPCASDKEKKFEKIIEDKHSNNPRWVVIKLLRQYQKQEPLSEEIEEREWSDDKYLKGQFYLTYALFSDLAGDITKRNYFIDQWEELIPESARPNLFRILFANVDALRKGVTSGSDAKALANKITAQEDLIANGKDPLSPHDRLSLLTERIKTNSLLNHFSLVEANILVEIRNQLFEIVSNSYFDKHIDSVLPDAMGAVIITEPQWETILTKISESEVLPSEPLQDLIMLQGINLQISLDRLAVVAASLSRDDWGTLLTYLRDKNISDLVSLLATKDIKFQLTFVQSLVDYGLRLDILNQIEVDEIHEIDRQYFQLEALDVLGRNSEAIEIARVLDLGDLSPAFLHLISHIADKCNDCRLFIEASKRLIDFGLPSKQLTELRGKIAVAYSHAEDDTNAYLYAKVALDSNESLGGKNTRSLLFVYINALLRIDRDLDIFDVIDSYSDKISEEPELGIFFADSILKTAHEDRANLALYYITQAFQYGKPNSDRFYLTAFMSLNELSNLGAINLESETEVNDGCYLQIEGLDAWYFIGSSTEVIDAIALEANDERYDAVINRKVGERIDWPADKYNSSRNKQVKCALNKRAYFYARSHQAMHKMAEQGHEAIWSVEISDENGSFNIENLIRFHQEEFKGQHEFFEQFCINPLPFAMLCRSEGNIMQSLSRIYSERKGKIKCNEGTVQSLEAQLTVARSIINGQPFFLGGLAALMLSEAGLLNVLIEKLPNIHIATSVIKNLRDCAENFRVAFGGSGRMGFVNGKISVSDRNHEQENIFRNKLISAASQLDALPNKFIGPQYEEPKENPSALDLDTTFPKWAVDTVRLAQERGALIADDDVYLLRAYGLKESNIPSETSTISLLRELCEQKHITWNQYLEYFNLLASYRFHLLPISVDDMEKSVLGQSSGGIILFTPKNIDLLNLSLTLSEEYGVEDKLAIRIVALFFIKIIVRDDVTENMSEDIFSRVIVGVLHKRKAKLWSQVISNLCKNLLDESPLPTALSYRKLELLTRQLSRYSQEFNPIISNVPSLLKSSP